MSGKYTIDQNGTGPTWRVFWVRPDGYGAEQLFGSRAEAQAWVDEMLSLEEAGRELLEHGE